MATIAALGPQVDAPRNRRAARHLKGGGAAGAATVGAAGVEMAEGVIWQGALHPLIPYLDTLGWLFISLALVGIALAIYAQLDDWNRGRR